MKQSRKNRDTGIDPIIEKGVDQLVEITMQALSGLPEEEQQRRIAAFEGAVSDLAASSRARRAKLSESVLGAVQTRQ